MGARGILTCFPFFFRHTVTYITWQLLVSYASYRELKLDLLILLLLKLYLDIDRDKTGSCVRVRWDKLIFWHFEFYF